MLSAMTMVRYIGVLYPYQYQTTVTKKRILAYVCCSGFIVLTIMVCSFYERKIMTYCVRLLIPLFLAGTSFAYTRIYLVIWKLIRSETSPAGANEENQRKKILRAKRHATSCFFYRPIISCSLISFNTWPTFAHHRQF